MTSRGSPVMIILTDTQNIICVADLNMTSNNPFAAFKSAKISSTKGMCAPNSRGSGICSVRVGGFASFSKESLFSRALRNPGVWN